MAQTIQIVPEWSFPHIMTVYNDYTQVPTEEETEAVDTSIKQAYAVPCGKGIDNTWVRKRTKSDAVKHFGDSDFKKYGQPYMQALNVLEEEDSAVWLMRVMPTNATYANSIVSAFYKADTEDDVADAHKRKFRIKMTAKSIEGINDKKMLKAAAKASEFTLPDSEGYKQAQLETINYTGRGNCGNFYSLRMSQNYAYEFEYGIKMYNFEVITSESGLSKDANYVGGMVSSKKYGTDSATLIDDVLGDADVGVAPLDISVNEDTMEEIYDAYIDYLATIHEDATAEYEAKLAEYNIPEDMLSGLIPVTDEYREQYKEVKEIASVIEQTSQSNYPDIDQFDIFFGRRVASTTDSLFGIVFPQKLTDEVDTTADDYDPLDYTTSDIIDFSSVKGLVISNGTNGYFDNPRQITDDTTGEVIQWTYEDELEECLRNAYNGTYDKRILSPRRVPVTAFFDANYPYSIKEEIVSLVEARNDCRVFIDTGIIDQLSTATVSSLIYNYSKMYDTHAVSIDIHNYLVKDPATNKKCNVTIQYFMSRQYVNHRARNGFHIPFVKENCQLAGHVKNSMAPIIEEYSKEIKEQLNNSRLNYFECMSENVFQRAVQNTSQKSETDLLEENNSTIFFELKRLIENDANSQIYNFADESVRNDFVNTEKALYANWAGEIVESLDFSFRTSEYEFNHSILHLYVAVVFRGLTKKVIIEIDLNKRTYTAPSSEDEEEGEE